MKSYLEYINEDDEWKTISGRHILIDPDSGDIKSGNLKGTNVKNFVTVSDPKKRNAFKRAFKDTDSKLDKMFAPDTPQGKEIDKMKIGNFEYDRGRPWGHRAKYAEKAFETLSAGLDGEELEKFQKEFDDALDVFCDKEAMEIAYEMERQKTTVADEIKSIEDKIKNIQNNKHLAKSSSFKTVVKKLEQDIKDAQAKQEKFDKYKDKIRKAKTTYIKLAHRYNQYLLEHPDEKDD